jgi:hypothetical protein
MREAIMTYLEVGARRVFAGALDWPGWCRGDRGEEGALQALAAYGKRYAAAIGPAARGLRIPADASALEVVERVEGNATTNFGAPAIETSSDQRPLDEAELERQATLLQASWAALDAAAEAAASAVLRKGPRGGGRELDAIVSHVLEADKAYLARLGGRYRKTAAGELAAERGDLRAAILEALRSRRRGEPPARTPRSGKLWTPRYFVRRSAWHSLDHAWEIEDRATAPDGPT